MTPPAQGLNAGVSVDFVTKILPAGYNTALYRLEQVGIKAGTLLALAIGVML
jgi:hypothetical protein